MEKEGVEEQFLKVVEKTHYEKLSNALDRRELREFGSTKTNVACRFFFTQMHVIFHFFSEESISMCNNNNNINKNDYNNKDQQAPEVVKNLGDDETPVRKRGRGRPRKCPIT